ncbi:hypothetical protein V6N13_057050 [Hibiscus sabdariffa]
MIGDLDESVANTISINEITTTFVRFENQNFENSVHDLINENYIASPRLVIAYALARTVCIDFVEEPSETSEDGKSVEKSETSAIVEKIQSKGDLNFIGNFKDFSHSCGLTMYLEKTASVDDTNGVAKSLEMLSNIWRQGAGSSNDAISKDDFLPRDEWTRTKGRRHKGNNKFIDGRDQIMSSENLCIQVRSSQDNVEQQVRHVEDSLGEGDIKTLKQVQAEEDDPWGQESTAAGGIVMALDRNLGIEAGKLEMEGKLKVDVLQNNKEQ